VAGYNHIHLRTANDGLNKLHISTKEGGGWLKMREWKMRYGQKCKGGNAGVENAGASKREGKCRSVL